MQFTDDLPAATQVSLQFDGKIPSGLLAAARAIDAARKSKQSLVRIASCRMKPEAAVNLMAAIIVTAGADRGCVERADFRRAGFSDHEIDAHQHAAFNRAVADNPWLAQLGEAA